MKVYQTNEIKNIALLGSDGAVSNKNADLNGDGVVSILDVTTLIDMLLSTSN